MAGTIWLRGVSDMTERLVSMESGLDGRNNGNLTLAPTTTAGSQWSPA